MSQPRYHTLISTHFDAHIAAMSVLKADNTLLAATESLAGELFDCVERGGTIFIAGNGGFGSIAQHFASELTGKFRHNRRPIAAIALNADSAAITCISNDYGFEHIFSRQLAAAREGDLFIGLTASGKSKNILEAIYAAHDRGAHTVVITGSATTETADVTILIPGDNTAVIQETGMVICHALCSCLDSRFDYQNSAVATWEEAVDIATRGDADTLLLDRDGVINRKIPNGYVLSPDQLELNPCFLAKCRALADAFARIFVVTNQKCVGKGLLTPVALENIHQKMIDGVTEAGGRIDGVYCSTDIDADSTMSKPGTGLADCISLDFPDVDFSRAVMVGDSATDRLFAQRLNSKYLNYREQ